MKKFTLLHLSVLLLPLGLVAHDIAQADNVDFHLSVHNEYDSSVGLSELDDFTRESDFAWILKSGLKGRWRDGETFSFSSHYEYSNHNYSNQNAYDQSLHHISLNPQLKFGNLKVGLRHDSVFVELAGEGFMDYKLNSLAAEGPLAPTLYLRVAYSLADKTLDNYPERSAETDAWSGDLFWFSDSGKHALAFSTKVSEEDARAQQYDYTGKQWKLGYTHKFRIASFASKFKLAHTLSSRRYHFTNEENPERRADDKRSNEISIESKVNKKLTLMASLEWVDNHSNLASVNYEEEISTIGLRLEI